MAEDKKKYNAMENVLNHINGKYISLPDDEVKRNNNILRSLLNLIIKKMVDVDILFKNMYSTIFYGGSFYDGLRVGNPEEFDLDLLLTLPKLLAPVLTTCTNQHGYVTLQLTKYVDFLKITELASRFKPKNDNLPKPKNQTYNPKITEAKRLRKTHRGLDKLLDDQNFLVTNKVLRWMEGVVTKALNPFKNGSEYLLRTEFGNFNARVQKGGPAFTLKVNGKVGGKEIKMDIDLVPCFVFGPDKWPGNGFRSNSVPKKDKFFIVPKPLNGVQNSERFWRLSFQEQERVIIDGKKTLKPTIKLLKKLRDNLGHSPIASYYIKTVLLWEAEQRDSSYWNNSLSYVFVNMLKIYQSCLERRKIEYFWNKNNNLLNKMKPIALDNFSNRLKLIINDIEKNPTDQYVMAKYLLNPQDIAKLKTEL